MQPGALAACQESLQVALKMYPSFCLRPSIYFAPAYDILYLRHIPEGIDKTVLDNPVQECSKIRFVTIQMYPQHNHNTPAVILHERL